MPVKFRCPSCNRRLSVSSRKIGASAKCPNCQKKVVVPDLRKETSKKTDAYVSPIAEEKNIKPSEQATTDLFQAGGFRETFEYDQAPAVMLDCEPSPQDYANGKEHTTDAPKLSPGLAKQYLLISRRVIYLQGVLIATVALVTFILGYLIGSIETTDPQSADSQITVSGEISYLNSKKQTRPDEGAVIIALPLNVIVPRGQKISLQDISPESADLSDDHDILQSIRLLGGSYQRANEAGEFNLVLPKAGSYEVLVLSLHTSQPSGFIPNRDDTGRINEIFEGAYDVLSKIKYKWSVVELKEGYRITHNFDQDGQ